MQSFFFFRSSNVAPIFDADASNFKIGFSEKLELTLAVEKGICSPENQQNYVILGLVTTKWGFGQQLVMIFFEGIFTKF